MRLAPIGLTRGWVQIPSVAAFAPVAAAIGLFGSTGKQRSLVVLGKYLVIRSIYQV
jgi:hypothetical protein